MIQNLCFTNYLLSLLVYVCSPCMTDKPDKQTVEQRSSRPCLKNRWCSAKMSMLSNDGSRTLWSINDSIVRYTQLFLQRWWFTAKPLFHVRRHRATSICPGTPSVRQQRAYVLDGLSANRPVVLWKAGWSRSRIESGEWLRGDGLGVGSTPIHSVSGASNARTCSGSCRFSALLCVPVCSLRDVRWQN